MEAVLAEKPDGWSNTDWMVFQNYKNDTLAKWKEAEKYFIKVEGYKTVQDMKAGFIQWATKYFIDSTNNVRPGKEEEYSNNIKNIAEKFGTVDNSTLVEELCMCKSQEYFKWEQMKAAGM